MLANSIPTAPAPMIAIDAGAFSRKSASSDEMTVVLLISSPICGRPFTREPVAMSTAFFASYTSFPTLTLRPGWSTPAPFATVTLFFFIRNSTPFEFWSLAPRERPELEGRRVLVAHAARALHGDAVVGLHGAGLDAELLGFAQQGRDVGGVEQ